MKTEIITAKEKTMETIHVPGVKLEKWKDVKAT